MLFAENAFAGFTNNAGGKVFSEPRESKRFMHGCGLMDPDGHRWNALYMDYGKLPKR